jgi:ketosteroid isomerase-like protein
MRRFFIVLGALGPFVNTSCRPQGEQHSSALSDADSQGIQSVSDRFQQHLVSRNADSLANLYTDNGVVMPPNQPPVTGRNAIRQWQAEFPPVTTFTLSNEKIEGIGDLAYVRGRYVMTVAGAPADSGKYLEIRRRQPDGSWKIAVDMFSSNLAPPTASRP